MANSVAFKAHSEIRLLGMGEVDFGMTDPNVYFPLLVIVFLIFLFVLISLVYLYEVLYPVTELQTTSELTRYITRRIFVNSCSEDLQVSIAVIGKETMVQGYMHYKA